MTLANTFPRPLRAIPLTKATRRTLPADWLPDPTAPDQLRAFATMALDAARQAGASFADIRIGELRSFGIDTSFREPSVGWHVGYGIRALVNGTWGFVHGQILTPDAVTTAARDAAGVAKGYALVNAVLKAAPVALASVPVLTGEWTSPVTVPPFAVPIDDHLRVMLSLEQTTDPLYLVSCGCGFGWEVSTRVYASSEGALLTQHITRGSVGISVGARPPSQGYWNAGIRIPTLQPATGGFELVLAPNLPQDILKVTDEVVRRSELPVRRFDDEGRFPVVFDGDGLGAQVGSALGCLLDGDRVEGFEADASGTTYLTPPAQILNAPEAQFSPLVTLTADRAMPGYTAVKWDDEGVVPSSAKLIENGQVRRYLTTRETAAVNPDGRLSGCLSAESEDQSPVVGGVHLTLSPAASKATFEDLVRDIKHGFIMRGGGTWLEPGLTTGNAGGDMYEVKLGKEVARVPNLKVEYQTRHWWKERLHALGDASTSMTTQVGISKGMPWHGTTSVITAPAALFTEVDTARTDIRL